MHRLYLNTCPTLIILAMGMFWKAEDYHKNVPQAFSRLKKRYYKYAIT